jgi:hypothetical protein
MSAGIGSCSASVAYADACGPTTPAIAVGDTVVGNTSGAADDYNVAFGSCPGIGTLGGGANDVAVLFTAPENGIYRFELLGPGTDFDSALYAVGDCSDIAGTCTAGDDNGGTGTEVLTLPMGTGEQTYLIVDGYNAGANGNFALAATCLDACPAAGVERCVGSAIEVCGTNSVGCLGWLPGPTCGSPTPYCTETAGVASCTNVPPLPAPGPMCGSPAIIPLVLPDDMGLLITGNTTCGAGNNYANTCLGNYDGGEEVIWELQVNAPTLVELRFDPLGTTWTGFSLGTTCGDSAACDNFLENSGSAPRVMAYCGAGNELQPGLYYLMMDTWPTPNCIPDFTLEMGACP